MNGALDESRARSNERKLVTEALYEAKVKDDEIIRILTKVCEVDNEEALKTLRNEKFILSPCRDLYQYLILEKGYDKRDADVLVHTKVKRALAGDTDLSKLSPAKLFDAINKANR